ncbi:MAG: Sua5/YciO/YrdC/YwlC family protein [Taibaiella sp.]|nr:Sua5/YciO/YrdC/YwlC family protein [Taibaiella sp.]
MVDYEEDIKQCVQILAEGGTILYPTDTVWGIGCDATNASAVDKVFTLKKRPKEKSMIVLLADARDILHCVAAPPHDIVDILEGFDRPTTVIYDGALGLAGNVINEDGSIAIRVTADPFCKALIKRFRRPIVSTSANISGSPAASMYLHISPQIIATVDYVVKYRQEDEGNNAPSRLVRLNNKGDIEVLRP